jgi:hypothetical protein
MSLPSEAFGIHQGDIILRSAIIAALDDLRANPWLLDFAFASLPRDSLTREEYGQREIDAAKKWFLSTRVPIFMSTMLNEATFPCISITQLESNEAEITHADTHYVVEQEYDRDWPALTDPFTPTSWSTTTGLMTIPDTVSLVLAPGQQVVTARGKAHEILEVLEDNQVRLAEGTVGDFAGAVIKGQRPSGLIQFESVRMRESYAIGCHVQGEQTHLTYLHSLLVFCLYRYKAELLEARGFERSTLSSSDFRRNDSFENELTYSRHMSLNGFVQQVWPAQYRQKVSAVRTVLQVDEAGTLPPDTDPENSLWTGDEDPLTFGLRRR